MLVFARPQRTLLGLVFGLSLFLAYLIDVRGPRTLVVEMRSDTTGIAQLFYDIGAGLHDGDSVLRAVPASGEYSTLRFPLPDLPVKGLRFDPLNVAGTIALRRVSVQDPAGRILREFTPADIAALDQTPALASQGSEITLTVAAPAGARLSLGPPDPLGPWAVPTPAVARLLTPLGIAMLFTAGVAAAAMLLRRHLAAAAHGLDRVGAWMSDPRFLVFDRFAVGCYLAIAVYFVVTVAAGFHGSSLSMLAKNGDTTLRPVLGIGKPIRSDEWIAHTPAILHQVYRADPFDVERSAIGPVGASFLANIPIRHVTTLFRPQFWGFFALPPAYGFAFYWQFKAVFLLGGVFSLILLLTQSSRIAALGTLWYATSAYIQWTYSWPSLLPEMIGLFCLVMCSTFYLSVGQRPRLLMLAAVTCVASAVNFALCAYIPHQIPLVWLGIALCVWWLWARGTSIFTREHAGHRAAALGGAWLVVALVMLIFYRDAHEAITTAANTSYPGRRSLNGGSYALSMLVSHFFGFWTDDRHIPLPQSFGNISECSGFFWLAPVTLFSLYGAAPGDAYRKRAYAVGAAFFTLLAIWLTVPLPEAVAQTTFMSKSGAGRSLHVLGLVNVALVAITLSLHDRARGAGSRKKFAVLVTAVFATGYPALLVANAGLAHFLTFSQVALAALYLAVVVAAFIEARLRLLAPVLILPQVLVFGLVNPLDRGLRVFEASPIFRFVHDRPDLLRGRWIVYSDSFSDSALLSAVGCEVMTGLRYLPDLEALGRFAPTGAQRDVVNRSGLLVAIPTYGSASQVSQVSFYSVSWHVNPFDVRLREIGVRYVAFVTPPPPAVAAKLIALSPSPVSGYWLYQLPD